MSKSFDLLHNFVTNVKHSMLCDYTFMVRFEMQDLKTSNSSLKFMEFRL